MRFVVAGIALLLATRAVAGLDEGVAAYDRRDYAAALAEFRPLADKGDASAQNRLGHMFMQGQGVPRDPAAAVALWRKAAEQRHPTAQFNLSVAYGIGAGVPRDPAEADRWLRKSADEGLPAAQNVLASRYALGLNVEKDEAQAVAWWRKAATQGHAASQFALAEAYRSGKGNRSRQPGSAVLVPAGGGTGQRSRAGGAAPVPEALAAAQSALMFASRITRPMRARPSRMASSSCTAELA